MPTLPRPRTLLRSRLPLSGEVVRGASPAHVHLVVNPIGLKADLVAELVYARCEHLGATLDVHETTPEDPGGGQAREALAAGADRVVVAGGDGTVRVVAEQLAGSGVAIGILPTGTANIFARNLGLRPGDLASCAVAALGDRSARVDLGLARWSVPDGEAEHSFLVLAGVGHDAETVAATRGELKKHAGWLAYFESGLRHATRRAIPMQVQADRTGWQRANYWSLLVGNTPRIPGGIEVFPSAVVDDDLLDMLGCRVDRPWQWLPVARAMLPRIDAPGSLVVRRQVRQLDVRLDEPTWLQLDGDAHGPVTEASFHLRHHALDVCIPDPEGKP